MPRDGEQYLFHFGKTHDMDHGVIKSIFDLLDVDGNGSLELKEATSVLRKVGMPDQAVKELLVRLSSRRVRVVREIGRRIFSCLSPRPSDYVGC